MKDTCGIDPIRFRLFTETECSTYSTVPKGQPYASPSQWPGWVNYSFRYHFRQWFDE